jgi:succinate dehydrogenase / fumarate reductase cytochrome b subunit
MDSSPSLFRTSIGRKFVVAVTGIMMVGFLVAHLAGNLLIFAGPQALYDYAEGLRKFPVVLWGLRLGLIGAFFAHVFFAVKLNLENKAARPEAYQFKKYVRASLASRTMLITGGLLTAYIAFHLAHFTWRTTNAEIAALGPYDVYQMLILAFKKVHISGLYIVANILLGMHLSHGIASLFQTLGLSNHQYSPVFNKLGPLVGWGLALGFISIPAAVLFGLVG